MRVQTDDGKIPSGKMPESQVQSQPMKMENQETTIDYQHLLPREGRRDSKTIRFCKHVLLFLAIAALTLACMVFIRDLRIAGSMENAEVIHPHAMVSTERPVLFPTVDEMMKDFGIHHADTAEPDDQKGKVISQTTRITVRLSPDNGPESSNVDMPPTDQQILDEALKMIMGNTEEKHGPVNAPFFGDLPFFSRPSGSVHPKLIIVKKISPKSFPENEDSIVKSILDSMAGPDMSDDSKSDMLPFNIRSNPVSIFSPFSIVRSEKATSNLEKYEKIIAEMDSSSAKILNHTVDLETSVKKELENVPEGNTNDASSKNRDFLSSASGNLKKIDVNLKLAREIIKAEQENLKSATDNTQNLVERVKSYQNALSVPLSGIFEASADLTKAADPEMKIPVSIFDHVITLGRELINFGRLMYEDVRALEDHLSQNGSQDLDQIFKIPEGPVVHRRLIIFRSPLSPDSQKSESPKEETQVGNSESKKVE